MNIGDKLKSDCGLYTLERVNEGLIYRYAPDFKTHVFIPTGHHVHEMILSKLTDDLKNKNLILKKHEEIDLTEDMREIDNHLERIKSKLD